MKLAPAKKVPHSPAKSLEHVAGPATSSPALIIARHLLICLIALSTSRGLAIDPPHVTSALCSSCHMPHLAASGSLISEAGNANLCLSCHQPGGPASGKSFSTTDQALPWSGRPTGTNPSGTSHRWDANAAGHVAFLGGAAVASTGSVLPSGVYTGPYAKTYTITIVTGGSSGVARFNWTATLPGGGSGVNVLTGPAVSLNQGVSVAFLGTTAGSFQVNDRWNLYVRADLRNPTNATILAHMTNSVASCSACHDQHSQQFTPFDPAAPGYAGPGTGTNRHFMRVANNAHQMCNDCHASRNVTSSAAGSHPVGIRPPSDATHKVPTRLPLEKTSTNMGCLTCHDVHFSPASDGKLLRLADSLALCTDCHTLANTNSAAHFVRTDNNTLWPGGKLGSLMPARTTAADRGTCLNCHPVHGWPDASNPTIRYPNLLGDFEENSCFTCHGTTGPATKQVQADFAKLRHHPVLDSEQSATRKVECTDCHDPHKAESGAHSYTATATATRNRISNPLKGVSGVAVNYSGLANFDTVAANRYTFIPALSGATNEYQICFKCHTGYAWLPGSPPNGLSPNGALANPVMTDLAQEFSPQNRSGHPIVTGLDNYPNSIVVAGKKGLLAAAMKAPWNVNLGQQTMMCSDCHNTDAASPAAQGPHGSAAQFILRGPNANNWPDVPLGSFNSSWCANCHNNVGGAGHTRSDHRNARCYVCHIVIPHGGKMSRLIADNNGTMPARYAWSNNVARVGMQAFTKAASGSYTENNNCRTSCGHHSGGNGNENW